MHLTPERLERIREMSVGTEQSYGVFLLADDYEKVLGDLAAACGECDRLRAEVAELKRSNAVVNQKYDDAIMSASIAEQRLEEIRDKLFRGD